MIILTGTPGEHCVSVHVSTGVLDVRAGARAHQAGSDSAHLREVRQFNMHISSL